MPKITEEKKDAVRMDILNTAKGVFIEKGYEAASLKEIVTSSGRSFGGVYLYFSNKEDVFLELLRQQFSSMGLELKVDRRMSAWSAVVQFLDGQESLVREVENGLASCMYEYFMVGRREEGRRKLIEERYQAIYGSIVALIQDGIQRGEFHPSQSVDTFVHWLISSLDGLFLESIMNGVHRIGVAEQFELLKIVCRSLLVPVEMEE